MSRHGRELERLAELEEERRFLLRSLDDLDREFEAGDVDETDYRTLRDGYTARAAAVIREVEAGRAALPTRRPVRWGRVVAITASVIAVGVLAGWLVARYSGQDVPETEAVLSPEDRVAVLLAQARQVAPQQAIAVYGQVLELQPGHPEALTYAGWSARILAQQAGEGPARDQLIGAAEEKLREAVAADPAYPDAHCFLAILLFRDRGDAAAAKPEYDTCVASDPPAVVGELVAALGAALDAALAPG